MKTFKKAKAFFSTSFLKWFYYNKLGDNMKKKNKTDKPFFLMMVCIGIGAWMSYFIFNQYTIQAENNQNVIYLLQIGSYDSKKLMEDDLIKVDTYLMEEENGKYFAYLALTGNLDNYTKLKNHYIKQGYKVEQRQKVLQNEKFKQTLEKYDLLVAKASEEATIDALEKELIQKYQEFNGKN